MSNKTAQTPTCCYIPCTNALNAQRVAADFVIYGEADPLDVTYSCEAHVGRLLGSVPGGQPNHRWVVVEL